MVAPVTPNASANTPAPRSRDGVAIDIIRTTLPLPATPITLEGRIDQVARDGTVRILVKDGAIEVRPETAAGNGLRPGQTVQINANTNGNTGASLVVVRDSSPVPPSPAPSTPPPAPDAVDVGAPPAPATPAQDLSGRLRAMIQGQKSGEALAAPAQGQGIKAQTATLAQAMAIVMAAQANGAPATLTSLPPGLVTSAITPPLGTQGLAAILTPASPPTLGPGANLDRPGLWTTRASNSFLLASGGGAQNILIPPWSGFNGMMASLIGDDLLAPVVTALSSRNIGGAMPPALELEIFETMPISGVMMRSPPTPGLPAAPPMALHTALPNASMMTMTLVASQAQGPNLWQVMPPWPVDTPTFITTPPMAGAPLSVGTTWRVGLTGPSWTLPPSTMAPTPWAGMLGDLMANLPPDLLAELYGPAGRAPVPSAAAPQKMATSIMLFMAALKAGDLGVMLGDRAIEVLRRQGKGAALDSIQDAMASLRRSASPEAPSIGDWKTMVFPMQFQGPVMPITLHMRDRNGGQDQDTRDQGGGQRYVLDVTFDRMGMVQLDMLYRPGRLDSILRTELPLSPGMRDVLAQKYAGAMSKVSHTGVLSFQAGLAHWVTIDPEREGVRVVV
jgi:hypothetical protein